MTHAADVPDDEVIHIVIRKDGGMDVFVNPDPTTLGSWNDKTPHVIAERIETTLQQILLDTADRK